MNNLEVEPSGFLRSKVTHRLLVVHLAVLGLAVFVAPSARANVYATNVKLNGGFTNVVAGPGTNVTISYILNEAATAGVTVEIKLGSTSVRALSFTNGQVGTLKGTNSVLWDAKDSIGRPAGGGSYSVSVTAAATGYTNWTQTSSDTNLANQIPEPRGITVNKNTNSIYYGRIFIGNSQDGANADINPLEKVGIRKVNADGTFAEEGAQSDGGYDWAHGQIDDHFSPWNLEVGADDRLYANDFYLRPGVVLSFDQTISSNSLRQVLGNSNYTNLQSDLSGMTITGPATNLQLWMADERGGMGIRRWDITPSGSVASNDFGVTVIQSGGGSDLNQFPDDVAVDSSNRIYVIQRRAASGDSSMRLFRFPPYAGTPELVADWKVGAGDDAMAGAYGVSVDPTATYVAVAFRGVFPDFANSAARIFYASNGLPVATLETETPPPYDFWDVAWDNAGNVYSVASLQGIWRSYSPPGSNMATTVAVPQIVVNGTPPAPPRLGPPTYDGNYVHFMLYGEPNVTYIIQFSTDLFTWTSVATNTSVFGTREIILPAPPGNNNFFRAIIGSYAPAQPVLTSPVRNGANFQFTLVGEPYLTYIIHASADLLNWTPVWTNTSPNATNSISITSPADIQFFRAKLGP